MKKITTYHVTLDDIIEILGDMGYMVNEIDCDKGNLYIDCKVPHDVDVDEYLEEVYAAFRNYFIEVMGMESPVYFTHDGDQPYFDVLITEVDPNDKFSLVR